MPDFIVKQGDTAITFTDTLTYSDGSSPSLAGATVNFVMRLTTMPTPSVNAAATITNPTSPATVSYQPVAADTATPGEYMAQWVVTFSGGKVEQFPTDGYLWVEVQQNITTTGGQTIVSLPAVKDFLNIPSSDRRRDAKLLSMLYGAAPVVEHLVGDVIVKQFDEWYQGGQNFIQLRHRPVNTLIAVTEFRGPVPFSLSIIEDPAHGQVYSVFLDQPQGTIWRRSAGGAVVPTPFMPGSVHVVYLAGRATVEENIRQGTLELIRVNFQETQQGRPPSGSATGDVDDQAPVTGQQILGWYVPGKVREMLQPSRRGPRMF